MMNFLRKQMKWVMAIIVIAFLLSTFLMYEGRGTRRTPTRNADGSMSDYEVAQINGRSLMRSELETRLRNYLSNYSSRTTASLDMAALYQTVLDQAILDSQLTKEVEEQGIRISDAEAEMAMKNYADTYYPTRETFYQVLAQSGIKVDDYKKSLARQMAVDTLLQNAIGEIEISEDKAVEFYDTMKGLVYSKPEGFMIHMADFNKNDAAEAFRTRIINGESWDVIVSNDEISSADLINITNEPVFLTSSAMTMGTLSILASLDVNEVSPVFTIASEDYAVAVKTSHVEESVRPYEEVSGDIKTLLTQQEQRQRLADYEEALKAKANVVINDKDLFARPEVSADETPQFSIDDITIEEVSSDTSNTEEATTEDKQESTETAENVEATVTPTEEPAKTEEPEKVETVEEVKEVAPVVETVETEEKAPEVAPETVETVEAVTEEKAPEVEAVAEPQPETTPEKVEEPVTVTEEPAKTEEAEEPAPAVEEVKEEAKEEPKPEEVPAVVEPVETVEATVETVEPEKVEEVVTEEKAPEAPEVVEVVKEEITEAVTESAPVPEVVEEVVETVEKVEAEVKEVETEVEAKVEEETAKE